MRSESRTFVDMASSTCILQLQWTKRMFHH